MHAYRCVLARHLNDHIVPGMLRLFWNSVSAVLRIGLGGRACDIGLTGRPKVAHAKDPLVQPSVSLRFLS